ncbi:hypothetical protein IWX49DRAFT_423124 [Phyllosticta citricarpa]|uniref:Uncharacterized protein n=1 Tax=Phyllosticta paracitricarpa TaxID=2016321 RepID=A0ABR1N506_9PEZI
MANHIPNILVADLDTRAALQRGTVVSISLPLSSAPSQPHTKPCLPRRMLFTLSQTCALQLARGRGEEVVTLPVNAAAPESLDHVVDWMLSTCLLSEAAPLRATGKFESRVGVYQAALALGIRREAVRELEQGLLEFAEDGPAPGDHEVQAALEKLPETGIIARALVKRMADRRRNGDMRHREQVEPLEACATWDAQRETAEKLGEPVGAQGHLASGSSARALSQWSLSSRWDGELVEQFRGRLDQHRRLTRLIWSGPGTKQQRVEVGAVS